MADDLLRQARRLDTCIFPNERSKCLCGELADRIEKLENENNDVSIHLEAAMVRIENLEAALREIAEGPRDADKSYVSLFFELQSEARKALEGKDG